MGDGTTREKDYPDTRGMPLTKATSNSAAFLCCMYKYPHCLLYGRRIMQEFSPPTLLVPPRVSRRMHLVAGRLEHGNLGVLSDKFRLTIIVRMEIHYIPYQKAYPAVTPRPMSRQFQLFSLALSGRDSIQ